MTVSQPRLSLGAIKFDWILKRYGISAVAAAASLSVSRQTVSAWIAGRWRPDGDQRESIAAWAAELSEELPAGLWGKYQEEEAAA